MQKIHGYRALSDDDIALINDVKTMAEKVGQLIETLQENAAVDKRWLAIGRTDLQTGFMATVRAIAKPTTF